MRTTPPRIVRGGAHIEAISNALRDLWSTVDEDDLPDLHPATCTTACIAEVKRLIGVASRSDAGKRVLG